MYLKIIYIHEIKINNNINIKKKVGPHDKAKQKRPMLIPNINDSDIIIYINI